MMPSEYNKMLRDELRHFERCPFPKKRDDCVDQTPLSFCNSGCRFAPVCPWKPLIFKFEDKPSKITRSNRKESVPDKEAQRT